MTKAVHGSDVFDRVWREEIPSFELYRYDPGDGKGLAVILDVHPATAGHALVITEECVPDWTKLDTGRLRQVATLGQFVALRQQQVLGVNDCSANFYGEIRHTHMHVIPKHAPGDAIRRMHPDSGRMQEDVDLSVLDVMRDRLVFTDQMTENVDSVLSRLSAVALGQEIPILGQ